MLPRTSRSVPVREILRQRLANQQLTHSRLRTAAEIVGWFGAVQSQDYPAAKWALGLRVGRLTDAAIERAFDEGAILRTHMLRPTWHFVTPADIRWMLDLTAPRVKAAAAFYFRYYQLDEAVVARSRSVFERALRDGRHLTREELRSLVQRAGISCDTLRMGALLMRAELEQVICSGPTRGKQLTYALFEERVPRRRRLDRDEALAELANRYFSSHGPATLKDFVWWSGLTVRDARLGIELARPDLQHERVNGTMYWRTPSGARGSGDSPSAYLLPNFDEYLVAYKDRDVVTDAPPRDALANALIVQGRHAGTWKRTLKNGSVALTVTPWRRLSRASSELTMAAAERYGAFLDMRVTVAIRPRERP